MGHEVITDWRVEIGKMAYIKNALFQVDVRKIYPHHLPKIAAPLSQIVGAEEALGVKFARDHAEFLRHADGWDGFMQAINLFGTQDFLGSARYLSAEKLLDGYESGVFMRENLKRNEIFPIAASELDGDIFVMIKKDGNGTRSVFWLAGYLVDVFPSFSEFFLSMMDYNRLEIKKLSQ